MSPSAQFFAGACVIVVATLAVYWPALHAGFIWDDDLYITSNPLLGAPDGLQRIWFSAHHNSEYCPLVLTVFRLEHALWGLNPFGYHAVNVLLHGVNALALWVVLRRLALPGAWLAAILFALHPVHVESVAWVTELKNTQSMLFYLLALLAWMKFTDGLAARRSGFYLLALLLYALALFSKTTACTLPAAMVLVLWVRREPVGVRRLMQVAPFLVLGIGLGLVSVWWETHLGNYREDVGQSLSGIERLLIATRALGFYAGKLVWPAQLTFSYPRWAINARDPLQYTWLIGCVAVAWLLWRRRQVWGRGPVGAAVFFVAGLSPLLGFIPVYTFRYSFVADHYQYVASAGLIALFAAALANASVKWRLSRVLGFAAASALVLGLGALTWLQGSVYQDLETLWQDTVAKNPGSWMAHNNLGRVYLTKNDPARAEIHFQKALEINPRMASARNNLGLMYYDRGQMDQALNEFTRALEADPSYSKTYNNLALVFQKRGEEAKAIEFYEKAIALSQDFPEPRVNLGRIYRNRKQYDQAIPLLEKAIAVAPYSASAYRELGLVCEELNQLDRACELYSQGLKRSPGSPLFLAGLGYVHARQGKTDEAIKMFGAAIRGNPAYGNAYYGLATVLRSQNRNQEAAGHFLMAGERGVRLQADEQEFVSRFGTNNHPPSVNDPSRLNPAH